MKQDVLQDSEGVLQDESSASILKQSCILPFRQDFINRFVKIDSDNKRYIDEQQLFSGPEKLSIDEFNQLKHMPLSLPYFKADYLKPITKKSDVLSSIFAFKLPIFAALAFWFVQAVTLAYTAPNENVCNAIIVGTIAWWAIEQGYHRLGHVDVTTESQMKFVYDLHISHHLDPDRPGNTVSPLAKNLILQAAIYYLLCGVAAGYQFLQGSSALNPQLTLAVITAQFTFYEYTHWLSHSTDAALVRQTPVVGNMLANIVANHRQHHKMPDSYYSVSSGYYGTWVERQCESIVNAVMPDSKMDNKLAP